MDIFNKETFMLQAIQNAEPQSHRSKWTDTEEKIIADCIQRGLSLSDIKRIITIRSLGAIRTRANNLGYGYYHNKDDGLTDIHRCIHENRRTKDEILSETKIVPIKTTLVVEDSSKNLP